MARYSDVIAGLQLFASKEKPNAHMGGAEHDVIFGAPLTVQLTEEEIKQLEEWGWHQDTEIDCWTHFV